MKWVIFGLSVSSSWGNGHATLWRGLIQALARKGHRVVFFERDLPFYANSRDVEALPAPCELVLYPDWSAVRARAERALEDADVGMVTSYCPDGRVATDLLLDSAAEVKAFYDLDTPITLERTRSGEPVDYIGPEGLGGFDVVLSFTGGRALEELERRFGARRAVPLYGSVDPSVHFPVEPRADLACDFSYLGTYAANRQDAVERLFLAPARRLGARKFVIGGSQYPQAFPWEPNIFYLSHVPPHTHPAFYCSSALTLNVTRGPMKEMGFCPSGRLFEAAACRVPVLTDCWEGLDAFFTPGDELLTANDTEEAVAAIARSPEDLKRIGQRAYERVMEAHTAEHRARELIAAMEVARRHEPRAQPCEVNAQTETVRG